MTQTTSNQSDLKQASRRKVALITGMAGQDGCLLAELLLSRGYAVYGTVRNLSFDGLSRTSHLRDQVHLIAGDPSKIRLALGWAPKTSFGQLVHLMVQSDLRTLSSSPDYLALQAALS